jgi:hypothetical protein
MKRIMVTLLTCASLYTFSNGQERDTLIYDPSSGNYIIHYHAVLTFARSRVGTLRRLTREDMLNEGEVLVERDSLLTTVFEPGTKIEPIIQCVVAFDAQNNEFSYAYGVRNGPESIQSLFDITIDFGNGVEVSSATTNGWSNGQDYEAGNEGPANRWSWFPVEPSSHTIEPGAYGDGFKLTSSGMPGIKNCYFQGKRTIFLEFQGGIPDGSIGKEVHDLTAFPADYVVRRTIAPVEPPSPFDATNFVDTLISYKHQALALGWITNQGIANSFDQKLENAHKQLERGNNKAAKNMLEAFLNEVEAQKDKHLTSEAYALLKFNAEYLISELKQ